MTDSVSRPHGPAPTCRGRLSRLIGSATVLALTLPIATVAQAQGTGNRHFTAAPAAKSGQGSGDMILGIPANTIFFVAVAVIGVLWFTVGGGRKAKFEQDK